MDDDVVDAEIVDAEPCTDLVLAAGTEVEPAPIICIVSDIEDGIEAEVDQSCHPPQVTGDAPAAASGGGTGGGRRGGGFSGRRRRRGGGGQGSGRGGVHISLISLPGMFSGWLDGWFSPRTNVASGNHATGIDVRRPRPQRRTSH